MNILCIDPGTHIGWATLVDGIEDYGCVSFPAELRGETFDCFAKWLNEKIEAYRIELIAYEDAPFVFRSSDARIVIIGIIANIMAAAYAYETMLDKVSPSTLKKYGAGHGFAKKAAMKQALLVKHCIKAKNEHIVDAIWLLKYIKEKRKC